MAGERQTEPQADRSLTEVWREDGAEAAWRTRCLRAEAELARVRAENERLRRSALGETYTDEGTQIVLDDLRRTKACAEAAEARAENQAAEIVALIRSYTNVHMTKALADLIEHKYVDKEAT